MVLALISQSYSILLGRFLYIPHPFATRYCYLVRLACVKHTASVRSELGSNSQVENLIIANHSN